ncbi:MAG: Ppx/GppA family phosphatase [Roseofilum sp. SBFL]|uniref:Ppx/GppA phosphatase family protein n=1 Tax=unclassified Roseofilum TaxID=2620099 RepID=UPI001B143CFF|nr:MULTISPECIES: Ppx/GppA phosphatase family protein [unclassified Roseofilum]MBP0011633.1 Ppx/GppA family phosphatase [Roseofilum sp. SID3]MBP0025862.1 Ppx/GppA family phosphatase [Roseofilum sp. SID2]MBP0040062.1 Ppx/GppA family phosphatase [Roseofilum sp. SID1]MBP0044001.1 Ppx/GppA family phosphatase [Roseofilum sp. SBFL]
MVNQLVDSSTLIQTPTFPTPETPQILAAIDVGTNSVHMVVVRIDPTLPAFTIIDREKETVRLGDRDSKTGELKVEVMERAIAAFRRFLQIAKSLEADEIVAVATSAVRESPNGRDFLKQIKSELGLEINLISGQEEARRIYLGVLSGMDFQGLPHAIIDIGGGSTELILGDGQEPRSLSSTKVGAVRLTAEFITTDPISDREFNYLKAYIRGRLERAVEELQSYLQWGEIPRLVGTSGTIETLACIDAWERLGMEPSPLTGYELKLKNLQEIIEHLRKLPESDRAQIPGMSEKRSEIIIAGALVLQEAMILLGINSLVICERALREGIIVDWMLTHGLIGDKLEYQSQVRYRSVLKVAQKYQVNLESSQRMANFAVHLFDCTQGILHYWGNSERELLYVATILHNCGVYVSHAAHHKHSYYLIRHGELLGYTENEVEIIANIARYHRKSAPKKKHENYTNLMHKSDRQLVSQVSPFLRLAVALDRRQIGAVESFSSHYNPSTKEFYLKLQPADINDNCELELWSINDKKEVFESEYGIKVRAGLS